MTFKLDYKMAEIDWHHLPPLASLRAFEATARLQGFSAAARALNVTPAAVAQQVRSLESEVGAKLVRREGRGLVLTEAGQQLAKPMTEAFSLLANGIDGLRQREASRGIRATTTTFIVDAVILPKLCDFWCAHPEIPVSFVPGACLSPVDFDGFDIGIRIGTPEDWPDYRCEPLIECETVFVASPKLAASAAPQDLPWILGPADRPDARMLAETGIDVDRVARRDIGEISLEIEAARRGIGAIMATDVIVRRHLDDGSLVKLDLTYPRKSVYHVILPSGPVRPSVRTFVDWLKSSLAA
ncbi:LysR family transcriptional regulator [Mameliella alba]|uniref:LysR family transcriptional regulator n=1 Tax=Mameliella alba TaxID=561184 RepID=UPI000B52F2F9|nr:LysR family transcriptional regulator [Mameliella alba]MBY6120522.1 LysR family transcriptional regulator [Mameliella alba]OWV42842.1 hypothetical protein CDZ95_12000 [Mameliella alba]OWV63512.1 hypothetical protein CDZ97_13480 [Mameliella alba]